MAAAWSVVGVDDVEGAGAAGAGAAPGAGALAEKPELKPVAGAAVWACKPALSDTTSAASIARRQSDFENDFNMGNWGNKMKKLRP